MSKSLLTMIMHHGHSHMLSSGLHSSYILACQTFLPDNLSPSHKFPLEQYIRTHKLYLFWICYKCYLRGFGASWLYVLNALSLVQFSMVSALQVIIFLLYSIALCNFLMNFSLDFCLTDWVHILAMCARWA